jgi:serine/threonine protein kinase
MTKVLLLLPYFANYFPREQPENLLVEVRGYNEVSGVFICDFGVSKQYEQVSGERVVTQTARGTPGFAAPEALGSAGGGYDPFLAEYVSLFASQTECLTRFC